MFRGLSFNPAVSDNITGIFDKLIFVSIISRVVPDVSEIIAISFFAI